MSDIAKRLMERRANAWEHAKEILDRAATENRALSGEEEAAFQSANSEIDALDERVKSILDGEKRAQITEQAFNDLYKRPEEKAVAGRSQEEDPHAEVRSFLKGETRTMTTEGHRLNFGQPSIEARTVLSKGTNSAGGYTVPTNFYDQLVQHLIVNSSIMRLGATVLNTDGGANLQISKTTTHPSASLITEGSAITESDPVFAQVTLGAYKFADLITVSSELAADTGVDLNGYLAERLAISVANGFGVYAITGTGTSQPSGIVTGASSGVTFTTGLVGGFNYSNLVDLQYSVNPSYRASQSCGWLMADATLATARKLLDTTGRPIWEMNMQAGAPDTILGKPVITDPNVAAVALNAKSVLFGDFSKYYVRIAGGINVATSTDFLFSTDQTAVRVTFRADGALIDTTGAVKYGVGAAS